MDNKNKDTNQNVNKQTASAAQPDKAGASVTAPASADGKGDHKGGQEPAKPASAEPAAGASAT